MKTLYTDTNIKEYFRALTGFQPRQFQTEIIHKILNRQDFLLRAPTASGKTQTADAPFLFCVSGMDLFGGRFGNSLQSKFSIARIGKIVRYNQLFWQAELLFSVFARDRTQIAPEPLRQPNLSLSFTVGAIDDLGKNTFFGKINPFSSQRATLDKDRTIVTGFLPLKLTATSAPYDFYQRL